MKTVAIVLDFLVIAADIALITAIIRRWKR